METIRALVVDDVSTVRVAVSRALAEIPGIEVAGTAPNGRTALARALELRPDLVLLDLEMPEMGGLETLRQLKAAHPRAEVVMLTAGTHRETLLAMRALEDFGAFDFLVKPGNLVDPAGIAALGADLRRVVNVFTTRRAMRTIPRQAAIPTTRPARVEVAAPAPPVSVGIVAIGISTGGPNALGMLIPQLPDDLAVPVVVVQHMPAAFIGALVETLDRKSPLRVVEGEHDLPVQKGTVYVAPGERQMKVVSGAGPIRLALADDPPENHCRPSADYLFRSVAEVYGPRALGVIMTGMGADGTEGLKAMKARGARVLAQDEESCVVFGMPMEAIKAGVVDKVLSLDRLAAEIVRTVAHVPG